MTGLVTSQAVAAERADLAASEFGVTGSGITVGIVSDSFNLTSSGGDNEARDISTGDLPTATTILTEATDKTSTDEGRAIAQIVHDVAPGAAIDFAAVGATDQSFANAILALAQAGAKVIVDDISFDDEPFFQDGVIAQMIDRVTAQYGVTYLTAAGNDGDNGLEVAGNFATTPTTFRYGPVQPFAQALYLQRFGSSTSLPFVYTADPTQSDHKVEIELQWNQPYSTGAGTPGPTSNIELLVVDATTNYLLPESDQGDYTPTSNGQPAQYVDFSAISGHQYRVYVGDANYGSAAPPTDLKLLASSEYGYVTLGDAFTGGRLNSNTVNGHVDAATAISVGAIDYHDTPAFGTSVPVAEPFSSTGPATIYFDANGNALPTPVVRNAPEIAAPDGGDTTFFPTGSGQDTDGNGYPNFYGTSAAAAAAAGAAALVLQADPQLIWSQVEALLAGTALASSTPSQAGAGLIRTDYAVGLAHVIAPYGSADLFATGPGATVQASAGAEALVGLGGGDHLIGGAGADAFILGAGDTATGGGGADVFVGMTSALAGDTITDFNAADRIDVTDASLSSFSYTHVGAALSFGGGTVSLSNNPVGHLIVSADTVGAGGVDLTLGAHVEGLSDFNGDGHSDLLWRNVNSGAFTVWDIGGNGTAANTEAANVYGNGSVGNDWQIQGTLDFNGDGASDLLFRNVYNGGFTVWSASGQGFTANTYVDFSVGANWSVTGLGDFNGDGRDDLLWRDTSGFLTEWQSTGTGFTPNVYQTQVDPSWRIVGVGDFNGDGKDDLLWRNANGALTEWQSTGSGFTQNVYANTSIGADWHVVAVADFNGDGRADILFRNDNGNFTEWQSTGAGFVQNVYANTSVDNFWHVVGTGDFNDDGKADILWRNGDGYTSVWESTGNGFAANTLVEGSVHTDWTLVAHHYDYV